MANDELVWEFLLLHPDDELIVQRENCIPGMRMLLDDDVATTMFQASFQSLGVRAAICKYLRYKPGTSCIASFTLNTEIGDIWAHAIAYRADANDKLAKAQQAVTRWPDLRYVLVNQSLVVSLFPLDDNLHSLGLLAGRSEQEKFLRKLAPHDEELYSAPITTLRYKPQRRYVGRIDVNDAPRAILKLHSFSEYQQARRAAKSLHSVNGINAATVIGHSDRHRAILLKWVPGTSLSERIKEGSGSLLGIMKDLGGLLKEVHSHARIKLPTTNAYEQRCSLTTLPHELITLCPELGDQAQVSARKASVMLQELDLPLTSLHGDLNFDQIIVGNRVSLIDFDNAILGHAEQDLGNLLAYFTRNVLDEQLPEDLVDDLFETFIQEYERQGGEFKRHAIHAHAAIALLRTIQEPFRSRMPNWRTCAEKLIDQARKHLGLASRLSHFVSGWTGDEPTTAMAAISKFQSDASLSNSHPAVDLSQAKSRLLPLLRDELQDESLQLTALRLVRHKYGKRGIIEYKCESKKHDCQFSLFGKAYAKRKHIYSHQVQQHLWKIGFGSDATDHIAVPRSLGIVDEWQMYFQEHVYGEDGWTALSGPQRAIASANILKVVEKLQRSQIVVDRQHTTTNEIKHLQMCLPNVSVKYPELRLRIARLVFRCQELGYTVPNAKLVPAHRDFYPDQILLTARGLCLLDLDLFCMSHPSLDLGNFCGHLIERGLREPQFARVSLDCQNRFESNYIRHDRQGEWEAVEVFTTLTLARHVYLATILPDRASFMPAILQECELRLDAQLRVSHKNSRR